MKSKGSRKKGNMLDWFYILVVVFIIIVTLLTIRVFQNRIDASSLFQGDAEAVEAFEHSETATVNFDSIILFIFMGLSVFVLVSSYFVWNHPAFFVIGFFLLCIVVMISGQMYNTYEELISSEVLAEAAADFPKTNFIIEYLPMYIAIMGILGGIVSYMGYTAR